MKSPNVKVSELKGLAWLLGTKPKKLALVVKTKEDIAFYFGLIMTKGQKAAKFDYRDMLQSFYDWEYSCF